MNEIIERGNTLEKPNKKVQSLNFIIDEATNVDEKMEKEIRTSGDKNPWLIRLRTRFLAIGMNLDLLNETEADNPMYSAMRTLFNELVKMVDSDVADGQEGGRKLDDNVPGNERKKELIDKLKLIGRFATRMLPTSD